MCYKNILILMLNVHKVIKFTCFVQIKIVKKLQLCAIKIPVNAIKIIRIVKFKFISHQLNILKVK
jgi:hypothetical protein